MSVPVTYNGRYALLYAVLDYRFRVPDGTSARAAPVVDQNRGIPEAAHNADRTWDN